MTEGIPGATLLEVVARRAQSDPDGEAFLFENRPTSYRQLWQAIERSAADLVDAGLQGGEPVVLSLPNGRQFFVAFYGIQRAGGIAVPLYPGSGAERLVAYARRCGATRLVVEEEARDALRQSAAGLVVWGADRPAGASAAALPATALDDVAYLQYTSGSTGEPKGVPITHRQAMTNVHQMVEGMGITPAEVFVSWLPVHHDMGLVLMTMAPFALGARLVLMPASLGNVRAWLAEIERHQGTFTAAPDFAYRLVLRTVRDPSHYDLSSLRVALDAAEPVRARTIEQFEAAFGLGHVLRPGYGLAEATVGVSMCPADGQPIRVDPRGNVSIGRTFPQVEVAIVGDDDRRLAAGEEGEILVRSPANTSGYWNDPAATEALFVDGYLRTGDLGSLDEDGYLYISGRRKQLIIQGGRNIAPREVEEILDALPFVRRSAAVGVDRGRTEGEQIYAFVEQQERRPLAEEVYRERAIVAVEAIHRNLGVRPGRVYLTLPRTLPFTANGKLRYGELRRRYLAGELRRQGKLLFPPY